MPRGCWTTASSSASVSRRICSSASRLCCSSDAPPPGVAAVPLPGVTAAALACTVVVYTHTHTYTFAYTSKSWHPKVVASTSLTHGHVCTVTLIYTHPWFAAFIACLQFATAPLKRPAIPAVVPNSLSSSCASCQIRRPCTCQITPARCVSYRQVWLRRNCGCTKMENQKFLYGHPVDFRGHASICKTYFHLHAC